MTNALKAAQAALAVFQKAEPLGKTARVLNPMNLDSARVWKRSAAHCSFALMSLARFSKAPWSNKTGHLDNENGAGDRRVGIPQPNPDSTFGWESDSPVTLVQASTVRRRVICSIWMGLR